MYFPDTGVFAAVRECFTLTVRLGTWGFFNGFFDDTLITNFNSSSVRRHFSFFRLIKDGIDCPDLGDFEWFFFLPDCNPDVWVLHLYDDRVGIPSNAAQPARDCLSLFSFDCHELPDVSQSLLRTPS